ncbi:PD-(D/E)XK nuclease family protein [Streptomyces sp. DSM 41014]|uniref:PD-(D/E)XK nuclease family protein n=1 Tax=Streptomyces hintoniae TaxID=3075521 RepID=A0ABU2UI82_9ACTN|nr:PD-(D/E)XK nuclease family protein [Streptomyces sp. DSM 41014]MDT0472809.1 PD-(D/E)XK nuclease family protein [Streptomyces sp. DSM 41014]
MGGPVVHRSVSQYTGFVRCGEAYRLEKIVKAPQNQAGWFIQGTAYHEAIEKWEKSFRSVGPDVMAEWYEEAWDREMSRALAIEPDTSRWLTGGVTKPAKDIERRRERGRGQVEAYFEYAIDAPERVWEPVDGMPAVELPFTISFGEVVVKGYIDQVMEYPDGHLRVRDLKTGTKLPDTAFQLAVYDHALHDMFDVKPGFGDYFMAKNNAPTDAWNLQDYDREKVTRWFRGMDRAVRLGIFLPNPGDACRTCTVRRFCDFNGVDARQYPYEESVTNG